MTDRTSPTGPGPDDAQAVEHAPICVMTFNTSEPTGAGGLAGDVATLSAMGTHPLPIVCAISLRDTAEWFDSTAIDAETVVEQARSILEDIGVAAWKVGFIGSAENVSAIAEVLADYPDTPLVAYMPPLGWMEDDAQQAYLDAFRELILPATEVLVGNHKTLTDFLLPDWEGERNPSARELAVAAAEHGARHVLVTGIVMPTRTQEHFIDNVLASPEGAISGEKFERFDTSFIGAGDTLSAAVTALLASGADLPSAVAEGLTFLDQALDAGFRPGMGQVVPDRFFWAIPPGEDAEDGDETADPSDASGSTDPSRRVH